MKALHKLCRRGWVCLLCGITALALALLVLPGAGQKTDWGRNTAEQTAFLEKFGWKVSPEPLETRTIQIPEEFGEVYSRYNQIQLEQGKDLRPFAGKKVEHYQYQVMNYPNFSETIRANLLVYEGEIIGGDISSLALDGFMHGFSKESSENQ